MLEFLSCRLGIPVYMEYPEKPPENFVVLKKEGNPRENLLDSAMLVADSYGGTLLRAAVINEQVKAVLDTLVELPEVTSSTRGGDYPAFDTKNKRYRYQAVQNITYYGKGG